MNERDLESSVSDQSDPQERILIVDDDASMRTALMESVRRLGYEVQDEDDGLRPARVADLVRMVKDTHRNLARVKEHYDRGNRLTGLYEKAVTRR